jgi:hypothetical protein
VYDIGQRHHLLDKIAHRSLPLLSDVGFSDPSAALKQDACTAGVVDNALSGTRNEEPRIQRNEGASSFTDKNPAQRGPGGARDQGLAHNALCTEMRESGAAYLQIRAGQSRHPYRVSTRR